MYRFQIVNRQRSLGRGTGGGVTGTGGDSIGPRSWRPSISTRGADRRAWEMIFYPDPDAAYTIEATFRVFAPKMVTKTDRHVMGAAHDQTVVDAAFWAMSAWTVRSRVAPAVRGHVQGIARPEHQARSAVQPRNLGQVTDPSVCAGIGYDIGPRNITVIADGVP